MRIHFLAGICAFIFLLCASCQNEDVVFQESKTLPSDGWKYDNVQTFAVDIKDTTGLYDLTINVRHSNDYENANLWLKMRTVYPSGRSFEAPVNIVLAEESGKWLGSGIQSLLSRSQKIYSESRMPELGEYRFEFSQNMRRNPLLEVRDFGIALGKAPVAKNN